MIPVVLLNKTRMKYEVGGLQRECFYSAELTERAKGS